jgi:hypothetical protein
MNNIVNKYAIAKCGHSDELGSIFDIRCKRCATEAHKIATQNNNKKVRK